MPKIGKLGTNKYVYHACIDCGKERWVAFIKGNPVNLRCSNHSRYSKRGKEANVAAIA